MAILLTETKDDFNIKIQFNSQRTDLIHQYDRHFWCWNTNMAAVTSCENVLYQLYGHNITLGSLNNFVGCVVLVTTVNKGDHS